MILIAEFTALLGLMLIIFYLADRLLASSLVIGSRLGISPFLASVLFLGFGTSSPEYAVSAFAAVEGEPLLGFGNVFGSNITNLALVGGLCAMLSTICISEVTLKRRFAIVLISTIVPGAFIYDLSFNRLEASILLIFFVFLMYYMVRVEKQTQEMGEEFSSASKTAQSMKYPYLQMVLALITMLICCDAIVNISISLAEKFSVSTYVIGVTIIAFGTSLPELVSALVSIYRKRSSMAMGTIIGSNIFNSFAILGTVAIIEPTRLLPEMFWRDFLSMFGATLLLWVMFALSSRRCIGKPQGIMLLVYFFAYMTWLLTTAAPPETMNI